MKIFYIIIMTCYFFCSYSQTFKGKVYTNTTITETISDVKIIFKSESGKLLGSFKTDNKGFFNFKAKINQEVCEVEITIEGYQSIDLKFSTTKKNSLISCQ